MTPFEAIIISMAVLCVILIVVAFLDLIFWTPEVEEDDEIF